MPTVLRVVAGTKRIRWEDGAVEAHPGDYLVIAEGVALTVENLPPAAGPYLAQVVPVRRALAEAAYARLPEAACRRGAACTRTGETPDLAAAFDAAFAPERDISDAIHDLRVEELLLWLAGQGVRLADAPPDGLSARLRVLTAAAPEADWTADGAARALGMSAPTLRRRLAAEGTGFATVLSDVRMTAALGLLQTTDWPVIRVAAAVGYASPSRFAVRFRARFGAAPHEIRGADPQE